MKLILTTFAMLAALATTPAMLAQTAVPEGPIGPSPYDVVRGWHKPFAEAGFAFGGNSGVFAESPDRIFIAQRGEFRLPTPTPPEFAGFAGSIKMNVLTLADRRVWRNCLYTLNRDGQVQERWTQWDHLCEGSSGPGPHRLRISPYDPERRVWVVNETFHTIYVFSNDGSKLLKTLGEKNVPGSDATHFAKPQDVAFLPDGRILIADGLDNHRVMILDRDLKYLGEFGGNGKGPGQFNGVHAVAVGPGGRIFALDRSGGRINVFRTTPDPAKVEFVDAFPGFSLPLDIIVNDDSLWITDLKPLRFVKLDFTGKRLYTWMVPPDLPDGYLEVHTFSVDSAGNLYGGDNQYGRTQKFVPRPGADPAHLIRQPWVAPRPAAPRAQKARERELKLPIGGTPGPLDAITDVAGVEVGHTTLISGEGPLVQGRGPVRTGVTVVHPRGKANPDPVFAAWFTLNGNGEMTGTTWVQESGLLEGPVAITNTHSVGVVRDAIIQWEVRQKNTLQPWWLPVVAETYDGRLNDISGFHVKADHVFTALDGATGGPVVEGAVGGGTGMVCHGFKGGIGTASRTLPQAQGGYTVGVLVQCNYGARQDLRIAGVPVGEEIRDLTPCIAGSAPPPPGSPPRCGAPAPQGEAPEQGSIIVVVATDAPVLPHQLKRIATRVSLGIGRQGGFGGNGSGDIFLAFSTANPRAWHDDMAVRDVKMLPNDRLSPLFQATAQATEAAITNALLAADTMTGANDLRVYAMPVDRMLGAMRKYGRLP